MTDLLNRYEEGSKLAGVVYLHRISDDRFRGITGRNFNMFCKLCGESALKNVVLVTNMWRDDSQDINEAREKELSSIFFKPTLDKGAQMVRHRNTDDSARDIIRKLIWKNPVVLQIQREVVDEHKNVLDTAAGGLICQELREQTRRHQAKMMEALEAKDEEMRQVVTKIRRTSEGMAANYATEIERMTAKVREMEQEAKERERTEVAYKQQLVDLSLRLRDETNAFAAYRAKLEQGMKKPQDRVATAARTSPRQTPYVQDHFSAWPLTMTDALNYRRPSDLRWDIPSILATAK